MIRPSYATAVCLPRPHAPNPYALGSYGDSEALDGFFDDIGHAVSGVAKAVAHVAKDVGEAVGKAAIAPAIFVKDMGDAVLHGERIDRALMHAGEKQMKIFKDAAVFAQIGLSFIPGIGQGMSAVIGAGLALAEGKKLTDALLAGIKGAIPGGPLVGAAFDMGARAVVGLAEGKRLDVVALEAIRKNLPGGDAARLAFDTGVALAQGKKLQDVVLSAAGTLVNKVAGSIHLPEGVTRIGQAAEKLLPTTALAHGAYEMTKRALAGKPLAGSTRAALIRHATRVPAAAPTQRARPVRAVPRPVAVPAVTVMKAVHRPVRPSYVTTSTAPYARVRHAELGALEDVDGACCDACDARALGGFEDFLPALSRGIASAAGPLVQRAAGAAVGAATNAATSLLTPKRAAPPPRSPQPQRSAAPRRAVTPARMAPPLPSPHGYEPARAPAHSAVPYVVGGVAVLAVAGGGALLWRKHQRAEADAHAARTTHRGRNAR